MSTSHEQSQHMYDHEDPDAWATWAIGIGGAFLMIATVAVSCGIYYSSATTETFDKNVNIRYEQRDMVRAQQQVLLEESAHWVREQDPDTGDTIDRLVIPIDMAMDIVAGNMK